VALSNDYNVHCKGASGSTERHTEGFFLIGNRYLRYMFQ